ncbi:neutral/alkaline non-lysosomal ceramidase N-terminal domain-containing protein [Catalinimonas alkaloidigena]|uniref:neutral/alkaline non-lysosomal ceramidase N-terminal domain-containing protein n=1 Tax=Catalinimonas alkaloidigena TaxID=1075417 RepID=UPI001C409112|nr:neutral/alkaline non-lysosomal ceramidase N-terminal domain-containing protein [Catalinimonas alkaloidigena]
MFLGIFLLLGLLTLRPIDQTPYTDWQGYTQALEALQQASTPEVPVAGEALRVGWAKVNLTPDHLSPLAGYGNRLGASYEQVVDSVYARVFVLDNGQRRVAYFAMDLLIAPPELTERLQAALRTDAFPVDFVYLTATHSHHSFGGWAPRLGGFVLAGKFDEDALERLVTQLQHATRQAAATLQPCEVAYTETHVPTFVQNRVMHEEGELDDVLHTVVFRKQDGALATLTTYTAHATSLGMKDLRLSADYPGYFSHQVETQSRVELAAFSAGAVGSHGNQSPASITGVAKARLIGDGLAGEVCRALDSLHFSTTRRLDAVQIPLAFDKPQLRLGRYLRFTPWVFHGLFGKYTTSLTALRIGSLVFVGIPADFSGELTDDATRAAAASPLILTSFNGGYMGYITPKKYYNLDKYETRVMNFTGPEGGPYLVEMIGRLGQIMERRAP